MSLPPGVKRPSSRGKARGQRAGSTGIQTPLTRIIRALQDSYGRPRLLQLKDPLSELIFTILSQNTSDTNRDRAWASLHRTFPSWEAVASASHAALERAIRCGGLAPTKSRVIQATLRRVKEEEGRFSLDSLIGLGMEEVEARLLPFKGVGLKTVRCVQVFSLGLPAFPVDTHIFRMTKRLGIVPARATPETAHRIMQEAVPPAETLSFHMNLITHGRSVCKAGRPLCEGCVIRPWCATGSREGALP